jgi:hypothetical protein
MPSGTLESLNDAVEILDKALASEQGIRLIFNFRGRAFNFRQRLYSARKKDRELNRKQYEPESEFYGKSVYDSIVISTPHKENDQWVMEVRRGGLGPDEIEEIENA